MGGDDDDGNDDIMVLFFMHKLCGWSNDLSPRMYNESVLNGVNRSVQSNMKWISLIECRYPDECSNGRVINTDDWNYIGHGARRKHLKESTLSSKCPQFMDAHTSFGDIKFVLDSKIGHLNTN